MHRTLISSDLLVTNLTNQTWVIIDCRFDLSDTTSGEQSYKENHIPGAVYAHLDRDLSGAPTGRNGRHPLPVIAAMDDTFGKNEVVNPRWAICFFCNTRVLLE